MTTADLDDPPVLSSLHNHFLEAVEMGEPIYHRHETMAWTHPDHDEVCFLSTERCVGLMVQEFANPANRRDGFIKTHYLRTAGVSREGLPLFGFRTAPFRANHPDALAMVRYFDAARANPTTHASSGAGWPARLVRNVIDQMDVDACELCDRSPDLLDAIEAFLSTLPPGSDHCLHLPGSIVMQPNGTLVLLPCSLLQVD